MSKKNQNESSRDEAVTAASTGETPSKTEGVLYLGIDLGTSRTSVSASNGVRETVASYVGYPKDVVSRKLLKKDVLYGDEAVKHRLSLEFYRPLEHGVIKTSKNNGGSDKHLKAAQDLIAEIIRRAKPRKDELVYAVIGAPAQASIHNKEAIIEAAKSTVDSVMLCSEPFSVAYGLDMLDDVLVIDIGAGTTDLCRMHGTIPTEEDEISYTIAGDAIDTKLLELIQKRHPKAQVTQNMCKQIKEQYGYVSDTKDKIMVDLPVDGKPTPHDLTQEVKQACEILVQPIVESIHKLIASFNPEFQDRLRNNVLLAGGGGLMRGLNKRIEDAMQQIGGGKVTVVDEPLYAGANGALQLALDMPGEYWQQLR